MDICLGWVLAADAVRRELGCVLVGLAVLVLGWGLVPGWAVREERMGLEVVWVFNTSAQFAGSMFGAGHMGCITVWDIDDDGRGEVLFATRRGNSKRLWCIEEDGSFQWIYPPIDGEGLLGDPTSKVSLVDVDRDGAYEICFGRRGGRLHVLRGNGSVLWIWDEPDSQGMRGAPQAYDVDGDGFVEFFINTDSGFVHRVSHKGDLVWTSDQCGMGNQGHPTICDLDRDGEYDVLWGSQDGNVYCYDAGIGAEKWRFDTQANIKTQPVIVADVNGDGEYEVLVWNDQPVSSVICLDWLGKELWRWEHPRQREGPSLRLSQVMSDVDEDGSMDMVLMTSDAGFVIDIGGERPVTKWEVNFSLWSEEGVLPEGALAVHESSYQTVADIDGDDELEILWLVPFPVVTDAATGALEGYYVNRHVARNRRQENGGWWGDIDRDGISEWICELNGNSHPETQVYCLTMGGTFPAKSPWPEYYHSAYPAEYQQEQDWLTLKSAYSNSLWFPIPDSVSVWAASAILMNLRRKLSGSRCESRPGLQAH